MGTMTVSDVTYPVYLTKSGTGTWKLTGSRDHRGVTAIAEGTLRFDSIAERGMLCSLGRSTICTTDDTRAIANSNYVDYAFVLGGGASDAIFEYTGEGIGRCTTRPLVLAGNGGHLRASSGTLAFYGISARDTNSSPTLTLDGSTHGCVAYNITNGAAGAALGIVKDGSGSWTIGGNLAVDGGIKVKQGSLAINSYTTPQSAGYKWFRVSIAQLGANTNSTLYLRKICLFNSAGVRQNVGLTLPGSVTAHTYDAAQETKTVVAADIGKGEIWFDSSYAGKSLTYYKGSSDLDALCNNVFSNSDGSDGTILMYLSTTPNPAQPSTWLPIIMRLPDSADPIAKFDIQAFSDDRKLAPTRVVVEASHDGIAWDVVYSNVSGEDDLLAQQLVSGNYNRWISDGTTPNASRTATAAAPTLSSSGGLVRECFSWYRLRFAKLGNGGNYLYVRQIGLFDQAGRRLNAGLEFVEEPGITSEMRTIVGTMPGPGQVGYGYTGIGHKVKCVTEYTGELGNCFDGAFSGSGGRCNFYWYDSAGNNCAPVPSNENTWIPIVMHLAAPVAVHHFDIQAFSLNSLSYAPVRFMLEGSTDGETWHVLYNNATEGDALSNVPTDYNQWLSDCASGSANNRPDGTGWNISASYATGNPYVQFANGLKAQVLSDGVLTTSGTLALNELTIDAASAGTIENFVFAQNGTVNLLNVNSTAVLPGSYTGCTGLENVANWAVTVNGRSRSRTRVVSEDGKLKLLVPGVSISVR